MMIKKICAILLLFIILTGPALAEDFKRVRFQRHTGDIVLVSKDEGGRLRNEEGHIVGYASSEGTVRDENYKEVGTLEDHI
jgi:hypothetical protein